MPTTRIEPGVDVSPSHAHASPATTQSPMLKARDVAKLLSIGLRTFFRLVAEEKFPAPDVRLNKRLIRWKAETVTAWMANQKSAAAK